MTKRTKLEHLQLLKTICMYGIAISGVLTVAFTFGWNKYGEAIKKEESRTKSSTENKTPSTNIESMIVHGDYVNGNKEMVSNTKPKKHRSKMTDHNKESGKPSTEPNITNHGNLSVGQQGGIVNQNTTNNYTYKPADRHINEDDMKILNSLPKDKLIRLHILQWDKEECQAYGIEINQFLTSHGYKFEFNASGFSSGRLKGNERFYLTDHNDYILLSVQDIQ